MNEKQAILSYLQQHKSELKDRFYVERIGLFGSNARGNANQESDVDIIFEFSDHVKHIYETKRALKAHLETQFGRKVDLCRQKYIKPHFRKVILDSVLYA